jgi:hypothetical protein
MRTLFLAAALVAAQPALAATITLDGPPTIGTAAPLLPGDFAGSGKAGSGRGVDRDGLSWEVNSAGGAAYGRYDPRGGDFIDSQDRGLTVWTFARPDSAAFNTLSFAVTDARDQRKSFFSIGAAGTRTSIKRREANGTLHWVSIALDQAVREIRVVFSTRRNDGFSVSSAAGVCRSR